MAQALCTSFKKELFEGVHNFASGGDAFKIALYTSSVTLNETTTTYSSSNEVVHANYDAGGFPLVNVNPSTSGTTVMVTFGTNPLWSIVTFTTSQALIYNATEGNKAVAVLDFGGNIAVSSGNFLITLPAVTPTTALLRLL